MMEFVNNPEAARRIGDHVRNALSSGEWSHLHAAIAFVKTSGTRHISADLARFGDGGAIVRLAVGVDAQGSSKEGLQMLLDHQRGNSRITVVHNENDSTFHPKLWLFENDEAGELLIGSGNLTGGGLFTNYEALLRIRLERSHKEDAEVLSSVRKVLEGWTTPEDEIVRELNAVLLTELVEQGYVITEEMQRARRVSEKAAQGYMARQGKAPRLFTSVKVPPPPTSQVGKARKLQTKGGPRSSDPIATSPVVGSVQRGFVMTLMQGDVGYGQTDKTRKTQARAAEVFVPLAARDQWPEFWGWPKAFKEDARKPGKYDRHKVPVRLGGNTIAVTMMTGGKKHDFRLRSGDLRKAAKVGDILRVERVEGRREFEYYAEIIPQGTALFNEFDALCDQEVKPPSKKRWGFYELGS